MVRYFAFFTVLESNVIHVMKVNFLAVTESLRSNEIIGYGTCEVI